MPIPEQYRKQLEQQRQQAEVRSQLSKQYDKEMAARFTKDMPSFSEWLAQRQQSKASGGKVFKKETRERNLKKFLDESKEKRRLYHGTQKDFGEFKDKYHGVFLTPDPEFSEDFSLPFNKDKSGGNTMPVHVQVKDPFDYENPEHRARLRKAAQEVHGSDKMHKYIEDLNDRWNKNNWEHIEAASMMEPIKHAGFDSYYVSESARKNLAVFDPKKIKSAIGNRGTYNTNVADINKAKGGTVQPQDPDYHAKVHQDLLWHAARGRGTDFGSAIYHDLAGKDFDKLTKFYTEHVAPILAKNKYPKPPEGPNASAPPEYHKAVTEIMNHWSSIPKEKAMQWFAEDKKAKGGSVKEPKSTVKAYKLFRVHPDHPGKLFPLFVDTNTPVEMNKWVDAKEGEMRGNKVKSKIGDLAYRPGWHAGDLPIATHIGEKSDPKLTAPDRRPANHAWAEVEMPDDVDWQAEATKRGTNAQGKVIPVKAHITDQIPKGGHYRYKTNPNMTGNWLIGGSMKVNKVLSDAEVARINKAAGMSDLPRAQPFKKKEFGFAKGGTVAPDEWKAEEHVNYAKEKEISNPFDYENPDHVETVANIAAKHKDFSKITDVAKHLATTLATGNWRHIEDPRIQDAIKQAGHDGYHVAEKHGKDQHVMKKAQGGNVNPSLAQMKMALAQKSSSVDLKNIGVNEAPNMSPKHFFPPETSDIGMPSPGGVATPRGMPIGGIDMSQQQGGQQLMPSMPQPPQAAPGQPPAPGAPGAGAPPGAPAGPTPPAGNMLSMTPQGQTMAALGGGQKMAKGGSAKSVDDMKAELATKASPQDKRVTIKAEGSGGVKGIVVPRHTLEGNAKVGAVGLHEMNEARAKVYGGEHREPLTLNKIAAAHRDTLKDHFSKSIEEQHEAEAAALKRLRDAKHLGANANTLDESEKLDTVRHEHDEEGRTHIGFASKGVAGHALYTSGSGKDTKYHVINTCPGQTEGCGGGKDAEGIVDTKKGTCFAPNAESQYAGAATRRAAHEQAKHDPKMTHDWILAHTGSLRNAARLADKNNQRLLFRPNVVDETDVSSRHAIRHLNEQRKAEGKPPIIANSYGKTNELHDPENGYYVTHSNVGPKVKKGQEIAENIGRDKARVRNTIMAADNKGDFTNEQGNKTPPKGSYMVTDVKRGSPMAKNMEKHITHAKYWTTGREEHELTPEERAEGPEGHFSGSGRKTSEDKAHYGHKTVEGKRFDYQRQHILHPRLVQVGENKDGTPHMIPTDSRFKDTEFLPKNRFKTKNGKDAGHILMTTPTESTSNIGHQTSFTHHVNDKHIEHAMKNNGEYEIDKPEDQIKAAGKEYRAPQAIKFYAEGGGVGGVRHRGFSHDDFHAFPEQNVVAQRHMAMRHGEDEHKHVPNKKAVVVHKNTGTMRYEMSMNKKAK